MRALFVLAVILAVVAQAERRGPTWRHLEGYTFERYCDDFNRAYEGEEFNRRKNIFENNLNEIRSHNSDNTQSWKKGVNQFADWTKEEFKAYNKHRLSKKEESSAPRYVHEAKSDFVAPALVDYRAWTSPTVLTGIKNQGACGGCWGFSTTESVESYFALLTGQLPVLSPQQVISCTTSMDGCGGGDMRPGWDYIKNTTGLNEEWLYPFTDFFVKAESKAATAACKNITKEFLPNFPWFPKAGVTGYGTVKQNDADAAISALANIGPQSISVAASDWSFYEGGIFQNNYTLGNETVWGIDHAVQLVGYGHDFDMDMDYWIVRNSWGTQWGEDGFIRLDRPKVEPCGVVPDDDGKIACGTAAVLYRPDHPIVTTLKKKN